MLKFKNILAIIIFIAVLVGIIVWLLQSQLGNVLPAWGPSNNPLTNNSPAPTAIVTPSSQETNESSSQTITVSEPLNDLLNIPDNFVIGVFSSGISGARDLQVSPGGTLLVSLPGEGKVVALPNNNQDAQADKVIDIATNLDRPHGLAFYQGQLYIATETALYRYHWEENTLQANQRQLVLNLPAGGRHWTRTITFNSAGQLFISIGSTCDTCVEDNPWHGSIIVTDAQGHNPQVWSTGLRNAVFMTINPNTNELWTTEMGRDFLGDELPPDEINIAYQGENYGWPFCYGQKVYDQKFGQRSPDFCSQTRAPIYEIPAHSAPLGLTFIDSPLFPSSWQGDLLVAYHGSWNRSEPRGYKIVRLNVGADHKSISASEDFISGWLQSNNTAWSRPVDVEFNQQGWLFITDDKAGQVYVVIGQY